MSPRPRSSSPSTRSDTFQFNEFRFATELASFNSPDIVDQWFNSPPAASPPQLFPHPTTALPSSVPVIPIGSQAPLLTDQPYPETIFPDDLDPMNNASLWDLLYQTNQEFNSSATSAISSSSLVADWESDWDLRCSSDETTTGADLQVVSWNSNASNNSIVWYDEQSLLEDLDYLGTFQEQHPDEMQRLVELYITLEFDLGRDFVYLTTVPTHTFPNKEPLAVPGLVFPPPLVPSTLVSTHDLANEGPLATPSPVMAPLPQSAFMGCLKLGVKRQRTEGKAEEGAEEEKTERLVKRQRNARSPDADGPQYYCILCKMFGKSNNNLNEFARRDSLKRHIKYIHELLFKLKVLTDDDAFEILKLRHLDDMVVPLELIQFCILLQMEAKSQGEEITQENDLAVKYPAVAASLYQVHCSSLLSHVAT